MYISDVTSWCPLAVEIYHFATVYPLVLMCNNLDLESIGLGYPWYASLMAYTIRPHKKKLVIVPASA
jgi:hypothetical protein